MSPDLLVAIINLIARVGIDAAIYIMDGLKSANTIDEAIAALNTSRQKTWDDYKREAANPPAVVVPPTVVVVPPEPPSPAP